MSEKIKEPVTETPVVEEPTKDLWALTHKGFGKYEVNGQTFNSKADAERYVASAKAQEAINEEIGDVLPEGFDIKIYDTDRHYRHSIMELPMNEVYTPEGDYNRYYDRAWIWAWAAYNGTDISDKRAKGYQLVDLDAVKKGIKEGVYPEYLLSLVREEGSYLVYGDSVLVRMPRALWRQRHKEQSDRTMRFFKDMDTKQRAQFEDAGVGIGKQSMTNELQIRL
jgi:hypothetical protein